jgi:hypothetical protein
MRCAKSFIHVGQSDLGHGQAVSTAGMAVVFDQPRFAAPGAGSPNAAVSPRAASGAWHRTWPADIRPFGHVEPRLERKWALPSGEAPKPTPLLRKHLEARVFAEGIQILVGADELLDAVVDLDRPAQMLDRILSPAGP